MPADQIEGRRAIERGVDLIAEVAQNVVQVVADIRVVVHDEDSRFRPARHGVSPSEGNAVSWIVNVLPCPGSLFT